ncbi:hypothetical protein Q7P37_004675 [Cladosporium fusiforme]
MSLTALSQNDADSANDRSRYFQAKPNAVLPSARTDPLCQLRFSYAPVLPFPGLPQGSDKSIISPPKQSENHPHYAVWSSLELDFSEFLHQDFVTQNEFSKGDQFVSDGGFEFDFDAVLASTTAPCDSFPAIINPVTTTTATIDATIPTTQLSTTTQQYISPAESAALPADPPQPDWYGLNQHLTPPPSVTTTVSSSKNTSPVVSTTKPVPISPTLSDSLEEPGERKRKRERNTEAARRYRQRRQDRLEELEEALAAMTKDRDDLRIKLARSEAEADVLRGLVGKK